jgi:hypothetical protein
MNTSEPRPRPALRVIHLAGGLRAFDLGDDEVRVGPDYEWSLLQFPTQPYAQTFTALRGIGLRTIGVDFIAHRTTAVLRDPPDFQAFSLVGGFAGLDGERAWSQVKNVREQRSPEVVDTAARFSTYHRLLNLRLRELSAAYNNCLLAKLTDMDGSYRRPTDRTLFANGHLVNVEAAIHAFLADAAGLRDLIAEAVWRLVLREPAPDVTTLATLLKRTRTRADTPPLLSEIRTAGSVGGWLKAMTELRNAITHVAPLANSHELHSMQVRLQPLQGGSVPIVHYPLTTADGGLRPRPSFVDFDETAQLKARFDEYDEFVNQSGDALIYASETFDRLVSLATRVRLAAGLKHQLLTITDADIIGPVQFFPGMPG